MGQLITVMPFMRTLVKITISGYTLLEAFENSVFDYVINYGGRHFLQVSGKQNSKYILCELDFRFSYNDKP